MITVTQDGRTIATYNNLTWEQAIRCVEKYAFRRMRRHNLKDFTITIRSDKGEHAEITDKPATQYPERWL